MIGRGFRLAPGKENCLVLDFGKNIERHGPVDCLKAPHKGKSAMSEGPGGKTCPECRSVMAQVVSVCLDCGYAFPAPEQGSASRPGHDRNASDADIVSGEPKTSTHDVVAVNYRIHRKKGADESAPKTMRVEYQYGAYEFVSEWICVEHSGFARGKAEGWWSKRCRYGCPTTAAEAVLMADSGLLATPETITIKRKPDPKAFPEIVGCTVGDLPEQKSVCPKCQAVEERTYIPDPSGKYSGFLACGGCHYEYRKADPAEIDQFGFEGVAAVKVELEKLPTDFDAVYEADIPF
jgi:DNA repair protein RadD